MTLTAETMATAVDVERRWQRHPADLARVVYFLAVFVGIMAFAWVAQETVKAISADLVVLLAHVPRALVRGGVGLVQLTALVLPVVVVVALAFHRSWRHLGTIAVAAVAGGLLAGLLDGWLRRVVPPVVLDNESSGSWITGAAFPSAAYLAAAAAAVTADAGWSTRSWRRVQWYALGTLALVRIVTAVEVPLNLAATASLGAAVGSLVLYALGSPVQRLPVERVKALLERSGVRVTTLETVVDSHHDVAYVAATAGGEVLVEVIDRDDRDVDRVYRGLRSLQARPIEDERPRLSAERMVEREALLSLLAGQAGVRVPEVRAAGMGEDGVGVVVTDVVPGELLARLAPGAVTDAVLADVWAQASLLRQGRIAHHRLHAGNLVVAPVGVTIVDFRWATSAASDDELAADVAELLCSTATLVGAERALAAAAASVPEAVLAAALPLVQPLALSTATRKALKAHKGLVDEVRTGVQAAAGVEKYELAKLERLTLQRAVSLVGSVFLVLVVFSLVSNWSDIWASLKDMNTAYIPLLLALMVFSYVTGAWSLQGAVPLDLGFLLTTEVMFAQSFLNRFTPANAGGMALRARYLQKQGSSIDVAAASVGITSAASGVAQTVMLAVFFIWTGTQSEGSTFSLPKISTILLVVVGLLVLLGVVFASTWGRKVLRNAIASVHKIVRELGPLAKQPKKMFLLFGGAVLGKLATIVSFYVCILAMGQSLPFSRTGLLYMTANTVAAAAPTPGGIGAIEAALAAVLTGAGIDAAVALSIVVVFRVFTFWLPTLPGWIALKDVQRRGVV